MLEISHPAAWFRATPAFTYGEMRTWTEGRPTLAQKVLTIKADEGIAQEVSIVEDRKRKT